MARDLIPATLAAGAVAVVVALFVGGTVAGLRHAFGPADPSLPAVAIAPADGAAASVIGDTGAGASVRVRPSRPPSIPVTAAFDLLSVGPSSPSVRSSTPDAASVVAPVGVDAAEVLGISLSRPVADGTTVAAPTPAPAPIVAATATVPQKGKARAKAAKDPQPTIATATNDTRSSAALAADGEDVRVKHGAQDDKAHGRKDDEEQAKGPKSR